MDTAKFMTRTPYVSNALFLSIITYRSHSSEECHIGIKYKPKSKSKHSPEIFQTFEIAMNGINLFFWQVNSISDVQQEVSPTCKRHKK